MEEILRVSGKEVKVKIANGIFTKISEEIQEIYEGKKIFLVTDENVDRIYGDKLRENLEKGGYIVHTKIIPPGEASKSFSMLEEIYSAMLEFSMTRKDLLIAFGGGVVGDLAGFAAATYLRGIRYVQVPSSLLAQIDSSIGGKVAVNLKEGKNLAGNFYHPEKIIIDPSLLKTLDPHYFADGMAEAIKYGCIRDKELFSRIRNYGLSEERKDEELEEIIEGSCRQKLEIVALDEKESGLRMLLNFGHTLGHGIEKAYGYGGISHGEAVAIGMYRFTEASEKMGITQKGTLEQLKEVLILFNLPYEFPAISEEKVYEAMTKDKKSQGATVKIILLEEIGKAIIKEIKMENLKDFF